MVLTCGWKSEAFTGERSWRYFKYFKILLKFTKMKKFLYLFLISFLINNITIAQINDEYWKQLEVNVQNFTSITDSFNTYISNQYPDSIPTVMLPNIKDYYRFVNFWKSRLGLVNDTLSYLPYTEATLNNLFDPYCESSDPAQWELLGPTSQPSQELGLVSAVLFDPDNPGSYLLSAENGGIWKSQAIGNSWANVTDNLKLPGFSATEIIRNPFDNNHIIASTGGGWHQAQYGMGIIESFDNGNTWSIQSDFPYETCPFVRKVIYDPYDDNDSDGLTLWAITQTMNGGIIYVSYDTGEHWDDVPGPPGLPAFSRYYDIEIAKQGSNTMVFVSTQDKYNDTNGGVYKYVNGVWYDLSDDFALGINYKQARITKPFGGVIFVMLDMCNGTYGSRQIFKSIDYGNSWYFIKSLQIGKLSDPNKDEIEYSPTTQIIYIGSVDMCLFRDDGLYNLTQLSLPTSGAHEDIRDMENMGIEFVNGSAYEKLLIATDGGISILKVNLSNFPNDNFFENLNGNHLPIGNFMGLGVSHSNEEFIVAGAVHCNSFKYQNGQWTNFSLGDGGDCEVNWDNQDIYYHQASQNMHGSNYNNIHLFYNSDNWFIGMEYEFNPNDPNKVYFGRSSENNPSAILGIWDQNTGQLVERIGPYLDTFKIDRVGAIGVNSDNVIFIADYTIAGEEYPYRFNKSDNDGINWTDMSFRPVNEYVNGNWVTLHNLAEIIAWRSIEDIVFNPDDPDEMWISIGGVQFANGESIPGKLKVLHSTDLGENWYDYSENLSPFPVMALEYQKGSNKRLFAGTDAGVYYRDNTMSQWECFNDGLPICLISDLDYDPCNKVLYASSQGRAIFKTIVPFIDNIQTLLESGQNIEWSAPKEIANDLIIPATTTLTISSNLYLTDDVKIIIHPGGKLIIDGGVLTNQCGDTWQGIEVWGDPLLSQTPSNQGWLVITNGGTIENAEVAVRAGSADYTGKGGGIISAEDAVFLNNTVSAMFDPYTAYTNTSAFGSCTFNYTKTITSGFKFYFARLDNVISVQFNNCTFTNNSDQDYVGAGIKSINSIFIVEGQCTEYSGTECIEWDNGLFENLEYGVYATASTTTRFADIRHITFTDNSHGIYLGGMTLPRVTSNEFHLNRTAAQGGYGLYLDGSTQYWVEDNHFESSIAETPTGIGIYVNASGSLANEIYLNSFDYIEYAVSVLGYNRNSRTTTTGLQIRCNYYDHTLYDETIVHEGPFLPGSDGIASIQGSNSTNVEDMAGNLFYYNTAVSGDFDDLNNQSNHFYYYYSNNATGYSVEPLDYTVSTVTKVAKTTLDQWTYEGACPSNLTIGGGGGIEGLRSAMIEAQSNIVNTETVIFALVDGGDTESLKTKVETSTPPETSDIYTQLMSGSPNLSETVVETSIEKEEVLPNAMIRDIMVANPHTSTSLQLLDKLDDRTNPMPAWMKSQILAGRSIQSLKTELEGQLANYQMAKFRAMNSIARYFGQQPENTAITDSLIALYQSDNTLSSQYMQAWLYLNSGQYQQGQNVMASIPANFTLAGDELTEYQNIQWLYAMLKGLLESGNGLDDLSEAQIAQLQEIVADETDFASVYARNMLLAIDELEYQEPIILPNSMKSAEDEEAYHEALNSQAPTMLEVYPNPSKDYVILGYQFDKETKGMIEIRDISGKPVQSIPFNGIQDQVIVTTQGWTLGVYVLSLVVNDKVIETTKFTLVK
jgi:hypothetical protein